MKPIERVTDDLWLISHSPAPCPAALCADGTAAVGGLCRILGGSGGHWYTVLPAEGSSNTLPSAICRHRTPTQVLPSTYNTDLHTVNTRLHCIAKIN